MSNNKTRGNSTWLFRQHPWKFHFFFIWPLDFPHTFSMETVEKKWKKCSKIFTCVGKKIFTFCTCGPPKDSKQYPFPPYTHPTSPSPKTIHNCLQIFQKLHDTTSSLFVDVINNDTNEQHSQISVLDLRINWEKLMSYFEFHCWK